ncbi:MAG TPA: iron-containing alcohol dehydrogenase [Myxococcota bacterium]|nr:iron-containing alcohol dehydrogenase [Myxococcota bacterium]HRY95636.1 iron-containing alcohol dehydrogenase [Myxococcota bacterium]HSA20339.1 iron-containing alcohol dehydrogenase [Myxococcota bacterium]
MAWEFASAGRVLFGPGVSAEVPRLAAGLGRRALLVHGRRAAPAEPLAAGLAAEGLAVERLAVPGEPEVAWVDQAAERARAAGVELVVSLGGGSVLDAGKAIAGLVANGGQALDYLEGLGRGQALGRPALPQVAVPTTAGTGSEVTRNAVLGSPSHRRKASLRSHHLLPRLAVVDPALGLSLPPEITAASGLDALTQLLEAFVCARANPLVDALCREGLARSARSLRRACQAPGDLAARTDLSLAALLSGLALANAGLGAVHGLAGVLGGLLGAPHGALCAALLPHALRVNTRALRARDPQAPALAKLREAAGLLTGQAGAGPEDLADWAERLTTDLEVPRLRRLGLAPEAHAEVAAQAATASSMKANPVALDLAELVEILRAAG